MAAPTFKKATDTAAGDATKYGAPDVKYAFDVLDGTHSTDRVQSANIEANTASKALVSNSSKQIVASAVTSTELGNLTGCLSNIQTQLDGKAATSHTHAESDVTNLTTDLAAKQATITGGATTIATTDLTASKALVSNASGKVVVSTVTGTELGYSSGVTSAIQTQLAGKAATSHTHAEADVTNLTTDLAAKEDTANKGAVSGYASLDAGTKVPIAQIPTGSTSSTVTIGNDSRLSDARTPSAHASTHASAGTDPVTLAESQITNLTSDLAAKQSTTLASAKILVGNVSNVATAQSMSGDATIDNAGATTIGANKITDSKVAAHTTTKITTTDKTLLNSAIAYNDQDNSYTAGKKQTVTADATNAGFKFGGVTADPSTNTNAGDMWFRTDTEKLRYVSVSGTIRSLVTELLAQTLTNKSIDATTNTLTNIANAEIKAAAAIAYSKLNLALAIVNADISTSAAIAKSKISTSSTWTAAEIPDISATYMRVPATETNSTAVAGANDTVITSGSRLYTFLTVPSSFSFYVVTGFEVKNGTVVNGSWQCGIETIDANPPTTNNTSLLAWSPAVSQSGTSQVQRISQQSSIMIPAGSIVGVFVVSNSATGRYGTTTVGAGNRTRAIALGTMNTTATNAWVSGTEEPYIKVYWKGVG